MKKILGISLLLNLLFIVAGLFAMNKLGGPNYILYKLDKSGKAGEYEHRKNHLAQLPLPKNRIVMLGNSLTAFAEWHELIGRDDIYNRGIAGDFTDGILARLDAILQSQPKQLFLMIGVNDLLFHPPSYPIGNLEKIIQQIRTQSPDTELIIQSLLPVNNDVRNTRVDNQAIAQVNTALQVFAKQFGVQYLDLASAMSNERGQLKANLTKDGIHLDAEGYTIWKNALLPILK